MRPVLPILGALACAAGVTVYAQQAAPQTAMSAAAKSFLATLEPAQKQKATFDFKSDERTNWFFTPVPRKGLPLKEMTASQRTAALGLLRTGLSDGGFQTAATIRELEKVLKEVEMGKGPVRDPEQYFFSIFGEPSDSGTWGWRYEGHHCAQNWTVVNGKAVASSPQFFGSNPAEVRVEVPGAPPKGTRALAQEEDAARALLNSLTEEQKKQAVINATAPSDIITSNKRQAEIQADTGLAFSQLTEEQKQLFRRLLQVYTSKQPQALARQRMQKIRQAGMDNVKFAWMGSLEKNQGHYYRVQGSTFLIEYDNTQNNANHIHAVWRDFKGDFGMDLLAMHYHAHPHKIAAAK
jgi:hypothetical protein